VSRARVNLDTRGLVKIAADRSSGRVLGVHVLSGERRITRLILLVSPT
jgi:pyruvate/2-oxoglutarate dehydrogenase complex dihydrolipoamide dehydrogenase (E3) component